VRKNSSHIYSTLKDTGTDVARELSERQQQAPKDSSEILKTVTLAMAKEMGTEVAKESSQRLQQAAKDSSEMLKTVSVEATSMFPTLKEKGTEVAKETSEKLHSLEIMMWTKLPKHL